MSTFGFMDNPPDFTKFSAVQLAQGTWFPCGTWMIPPKARKTVAHNVRCFRKEWKHISTSDVTQFMARGRFDMFTRAVRR